MPGWLSSPYARWRASTRVECAVNLPSRLTGGAQQRLVRPGDLIVGADDGVVVVPPGLAAEAVADSREQERLIAGQVRSGAGIDGLYPLGSAWRERYRTWCARKANEGERA